MQRKGVSHMRDREMQKENWACYKRSKSHTCSAKLLEKACAQANKPMDRQTQSLPSDQFLASGWSFSPASGLWPHKATPTSEIRL